MSLDRTTDNVLDDLRDLLIDAETLIGAYAAGYSDESMEPLRDRLKATQARITAEYSRLREKTTSEPKHSNRVFSRSCEVLALASGIGTLVGALADRQRP